MWVSDMPLTSGHLDPDVDRSAPPDLHHVTQRRDRGRLADEAQVGKQRALVHPLDQRNRAERRRAFLIAGDDERQSPRIGGNARCRSDERRDRAFHVYRTAPDQQAVAQVRCEGIGAPSVAGRYDIDMARKGEMRPLRAPRGEQVLDRTVGRIAADPPFDREAERHQRLLQHVEHRPTRGGDAFGPDQ